jgi:hypothetical protein
MFSKTTFSGSVSSKALYRECQHFVKISLQWNKNLIRLFYECYIYLINQTKDKKTRETIPLKGQLHEIFDPRFFSSNNPPDSRPKAVSRWLILYSNLSDASDTAETISAVSLRPLKLWRWQSENSGGCLDLIFGFSGVNDTAETDFGDFRGDYLGEYDAICKTVLAC